MLLTRLEFDSLKALTDKQGRQAAEHFLLEGWRALDEALRAGVVPDYVAIDPARVAPREAAAPLARLEELRTPIKEATDRQLHRLSATEQNPGVLAVVRKARCSLDDVLGAGGLAVALDEISDPGNLGAILRTCEWFGVAGVLLGQGCVELHNEKVVRATAGALFHLPIVERVPLPATLLQARDRGYRILVAVGDAGVPLPQLAPQPRELLVLGSEARGVSAAVRAVANLAVSVPRYGRVESLNVAAAGAVILAHLRTRGATHSR